jgi:hypothetical protein
MYDYHKKTYCSRIRTEVGLVDTEKSIQVKLFEINNALMLTLVSISCTAFCNYIYPNIFTPGGAAVNRV